MAESTSGRYTAAAHSLFLLQELVRKDPESYKDDFLGQYRHYLQTLHLFQLQPIQHRSCLDTFVDVVNFLSNVAPCYREEARPFADSLISVLRNDGTSLDPSVRMALCKALVALRNRNLADTLTVLQLFFELVKCEDKPLRKYLFGSILAHIKRLHSKKKDQRLVGTLQNYTFAKLKDSRSIVARTAQLILVDAYRKGFWKDAKTANAIAECCFHKVARMQVAAMKFLLGSSKRNEEGEGTDENDSEEDAKQTPTKTLKEVSVAYRAGKKTRKKKKQFEKAKKAIDKQSNSHKEKRNLDCNVTALNQLYDPQEFSDRLYGQLERNTKSERFELRLLRMALCARLIGIHQLHTLSFYSFLYRYLQPKQTDVTRILLYAAQATHELVPPDIVEQLVGTIARNFITDRNSVEAITVGLNAVREVLARCPCAATEHLLRDLTEYKKYKNKNVSMAAKGLIALFRTVNPKLLHRRDRGRPTAATKELEVPEFGRNRAKSYILGAECLTEKSVDDDMSEKSEHSDEDSWADVPQSSDSEREEVVEEGKQVNGETDPIKRAELLSSGRILTQQEHRKIATFQLKKQLGGASKRQRQDDMRLAEELDEKRARKDRGHGLASLTDIEHFHKKIRRQTKQERLEQVMQGRQGRGSFAKPKKRGPHVGRTNREMAKRKNFKMIQQKQRGRNRQRTFRERQQSLQKYLLKQKGKK